MQVAKENKLHLKHYTHFKILTVRNYSMSGSNGAYLGKYTAMDEVKTTSGKGCGASSEE